LALGGLAIAAGGFYLYYTQREKEKPCEAYKTKEECLAHGCYWYDNSCHSTSPTVCEEGMVRECTPELEGYQTCDIYNNLCRCVGGKWVCIERNSPLCREGRTQTKCFVIGGKATCLPMIGAGPDECELETNVPCPCPTGECGPLSFCDPRVKICVKKAWNDVVSFSTKPTKCYTYTLSEPLAATSLVGTMHYEPLSPMDSLYFEIKTYFKGYTETILKWTEYVPVDGVIEFHTTFLPHGIEKMIFCAESALGFHPMKSFVGHLNF